MSFFLLNFKNFFKYCFDFFYLRYVYDVYWDIECGEIEVELCIGFILRGWKLRKVLELGFMVIKELEFLNYKMFNMCWDYYVWEEESNMFLVG